MNVLNLFKKVLFLCFLSVFSHAQGLEKKYLANETYTYNQLIEAYKQLVSRSSWVQYHSDSLKTDQGIKVPIIRVGPEAEKLADRQKPVILILNGIHAGESCGIDASLHWVEGLVKANVELAEASIYIIPIYNLGGSFNRSCCTRANQNGPNTKGFRGNANNLDLNRDFIKCDSENALSFSALFHAIEPDVLVDTHSTNGADYQYDMTLIPYNWEKWPSKISKVGRDWFEEVKATTNKIVPTQYYVNVWGKTPTDGFTAFQVSSIYSGGYAGLFHTLNFTAEAHMFKSYTKRVEATIATLMAVLNTSKKRAAEIISARREVRDFHHQKYATTWAIDSTISKAIVFKGFEAENYTSELTGQPTYRYHRDKPIEYSTTFYPIHKPVNEIKTPTHYYLHAGNVKLLRRLKANNVQLNTISDTLTIEVRVDYVIDINYAKRPYEGHFMHRDFNLERKLVLETFYPGDIRISLNQESRNYLLEVFEAETPGSFFRWNFFDTYLQQKEWFSSYIFEAKAIDFLNENPKVRVEFDKKRSEDEEFAKNHFAQLYWVYRQTPYYEKEHLRIPVFRVYR